MKNNNLNILITGASRGIGKAIALKIANKCENLLITSKYSNSCEETYNTIKSKAKNAYYNGFDHEYPRDAALKIKNWIKENKIKYLDALILDAGIFLEGELSTISSSLYEKNLAVNLSANHYIIQELIPFLKLAKTPRIIIIGSTAAYNEYPIVPTYGVAKWALRGYAINLRKELSCCNIGVMFISPSGTLTDMWAGENIPQGRLLNPEDIAEIVNVSFMLSDQAVIDEIIVKPMLGDYDE